MSLYWQQSVKRVDYQSVQTFQNHIQNPRYSSKDHLDDTDFVIDSLTLLHVACSTIISLGLADVHVWKIMLKESFNRRLVPTEGSKSSFSSSIIHSWT